ncbi:GPI mannosyltransferase 2 [Ephemerocybe angulata]|uniref:GPI mannosyltransferase 2 n=1 Tax=Ephemerocybe angulata TaxID=980116 RepID=A0A8H6I8W6_9AGAR|nr:GPI mannosyltransferase 2 [Tulosesus angulatus]
MFLLLLLRALASFVPQFDTAANDVLVRWDVLHFSAIADNGYLYEHQWAFLPALPAILRTGLIPTAAIVSIISLDSIRTLYGLSAKILKNEDVARIATVLALLPSSPVTLFLVPYNEPFYTYLSYRGMYYCAQSQWLKASIAFALASCFRSNGVFLAGFIIWGILINPEKPASVSSLVRATALTALVFAPFVYHNHTGYASFCIDNPHSPPEWCSRFIPSIYTHVQEKYWDNGLFKYWTLQQLPNILLGVPPLALIYSFGFWHLNAAYHRLPSPFASVSLTPHVLHAIFMASVLLLASNTQIILRLAASMPVLYWAAAWLWTHSTDDGKTFKFRSWGKAWIYWSAIWGSVSIVLWVAFLPPA